MIGPPGSGKTLMARCMPTILPDMTFAGGAGGHAHPLRGRLRAGQRPAGRASLPLAPPHRLARVAGGRRQQRPARGDFSKAHNGVLFLDELPEYRRDVLEALRQPLEDGFVTITRVNAQATYPARFMLICSMNPCPCGHLRQPHAAVPLLARGDSALSEPHLRPAAGPHRHAHRGGVHSRRAAGPI